MIYNRIFTLITKFKSTIFKSMMMEKLLIGSRKLWYV